ncbi:signal peptidase I [Ornithinimicrobium pratense]|uniref:Signal peptidase I n=1 Tax=Ornithinimicrobium pratense TaxID=2593973 RepID=A0A5J6V904_9MICO|nr:signal peptidase I [Ornithinimicrobium pratense]QFG69593.1 signal peptidase I [Ornithinimicrobium pratense]
MQQTKHWARRLLSLAGNLGLVALVLACTAYLLPQALGYERYVITGGSMSGSIEKGSVVFAEPRPVEGLAVGDVITYLPPASSGVGNLVTHRIVDIGADAAGELVFRTQGDANADVDPWTFGLLADEQPVVTQSVPYVGYVLIALADREARMVLIGIPAAVIALLALVELGRSMAGLWRERESSEDPHHAATSR